MRQHPIEDPDGDEREAQDREERAREKGGELIPLGGYIDVDRIEAEKAAAGPRPIRSTPERLAEVQAPRLVVAGDVVAELERQHRRAYRRRQERNARQARRRAFVDDVLTAVVALAGTVALLALFAELAGRR